jgi:hypothetical protein
MGYRDEGINRNPQSSYSYPTHVRQRSQSKNGGRSYMVKRRRCVIVAMAIDDVVIDPLANDNIRAYSH